jgi:carbon starvation protein
VSILLILAVAGVALLLGGRFYAPLIARVLGERADRPTPAAVIDDGRDYVPTPTPVVFAHHYASIAGAGPIIGPVLAIYYGWLPALLWIVLGGVFLGAVHDFAATHITMREGGKNLAVVARRYLGPAVFGMLIVMLVALLVLVCAAFLDLSATALTSQVGVKTLGLPADQTLLRSRTAVFFRTEAKLATAAVEEAALLAALRPEFEANNGSLSAAATITATEPGRAWKITDGNSTYLVSLAMDQRGTERLEIREVVAVVGGIASTSVIVITAFSPLLGFLYIKRKVSVWLCSLLALGVCGLSIFIGLNYPLSVEPQTWKLMISGYVLIAAGVPVWLFLQSRDFINVHILYAGIVFLVVAVVAAALRGTGEFAHQGAIPPSNWLAASAHPKLGPGWPILFITIACGAVSGFHSLCAGGTTCKQLRTEVAARQVGYYAMLLESFLAVCVVCCLIVGLSLLGYQHFCYPTVGKGNAVLTFALAVGNTSNLGLGIPVAFGVLGAMLLLEGFLVTTLDTAIRLTRYMIEEGWASLFRRYDVFAERARAVEAAVPALRAATEMVGAGGMTIERPNLQADRPIGPPIATSGPPRLLLRGLKYYWVNSGIAVALMLLLGWGNGYNVVWKIFGSANQLLAALALIVASCWLLARRRPVWYTLLPAVFMLVTSVYSLVYLLWTQYLAAWPSSAPLTITAIIVLAVTAGIVLVALRRFARPGRATTVPV